MNQLTDAKKTIINVAAGLVTGEPLLPLTVLLASGGNNYGRRSLVQAQEEIEENVKKLAVSLRVALDNMPLPKLTQEAAALPTGEPITEVKRNMLENFVREGFAAVPEDRLQAIIGGEEAGPEEVVALARIVLSFKGLNG